MYQLTERLTEEKYNGSYEQIGKVILKALPTQIGYSQLLRIGSFFVPDWKFRHAFKKLLFDSTARDRHNPYSCL